MNTHFPILRLKRFVMRLTERLCGFWVWPVRSYYETFSTIAGLLHSIIHLQQLSKHEPTLAILQNRIHTDADFYDSRESAAELTFTLKAAKLLIRTNARNYKAHYYLIHSHCLVAHLPPDGVLHHA